jgi:hypothetical protein
LYHLIEIQSDTPDRYKPYDMVCSECGHEIYEEGCIKKDKKNYCIGCFKKKYFPNYKKPGPVSVEVLIQNYGTQRFLNDFRYKFNYSKTITKIISNYIIISLAYRFPRTGELHQHICDFGFEKSESYRFKQLLGFDTPIEIVLSHNTFEVLKSNTYNRLINILETPCL